MLERKLFNGCIEFAPNLPWKGKIPLAQLISEQIDGIPVALTNDANAAAIGEMTYGAASRYERFYRDHFGYWRG